MHNKCRNQLIVCLVMLVSLLVGCNLMGENRQALPPVQLAEPLKTHYLIDQEYVSDPENLFATMGHLLVFNPGDRNAKLKLTLYFEKDPPQSFSLKAAAKTSTESNYKSWPIKPKLNSVFAIKVESNQSVICQSTIGWTNTNNDYHPSAKTKSPKGIRETAKSYMSIKQLSQDWYVADGIVIDLPKKLWIRESEWAIVLNPGSQDAQLTLLMYYGKKTVQKKVTVPAQRMQRIFMDDLVERNKHYGVRIISDHPIAAQWLRTVNWYDSRELMATWSVPAVPNFSTK